MLKHVFIAALCLAFSLGLHGQENTEDSTEEKSSNEKQKAEEGPGNTVKLESVFVGDKEQPAISYFIPWQGVGTPDNLHWNVEEKHDNALDLVDREIMLRSIYFYEEMQLENPTEASE